MSRPEIAPEILADITRAAPERVSKKLDAAPKTAESWTWTFGETVTVFTGSETVTLAVSAGGRLVGRDAIRCTCLLQPRCFHLLAVVTLLPVGMPALASAADEATAPSKDEPEDEELTREQKATAADALRLGALVLTDGLSRVSTLRLGELVRIAHSCRKSGLVRLESAVMAVFEAARALREDSPDFTLDAAATGLAELLLVATKLSLGDPAWVGVARRAYREAASLKLAGVACEPVVSKGYAGVVTYFTDGARVLATQEILPGDDDRAVQAYDAQLRFGEVSLSHREASRAGLVFATARVSSDDRLGAGKAVTCAATGRDGALVSRLFEEPVKHQLARADRGERHGLVFVRGTLRAGRIDLDGPLPHPGNGSLPLSVPIDHARFAFRENLERLVRAGAHVHLVARQTRDDAALAPLAVMLEDKPWVNLGYDRLGATDVPAAAAGADEPALEPDLAVLDSVRRRVLRFAIVGRQSLPSAALPDVVREGARLRSSLLVTGADALETLAVRTAESPAAAAEGWLALHVYWRAAHKSLARSLHLGA